ncbi:MAG: hypothetical protein A2161_00155 [Candidatus Schekmanbacteria bacterium RBG_13_48_7]|uniref:Uncharacterized protein n=1 Tax=Candidatus Schekmanbacteria bacterium RBG_13_48_7 TaxID=1817878 RepID=A0A1F7RYI2_9BACT|nr:MAG: hypothetical protein A2161_00155 [Candidatus Schekmanbacteria bacterium RBG_13_48_7]
MMRKKPQPPKPDKIRRITGSFGWIDHRFVRDGFMQLLKPTELLLYFFLATVADAKGISYYGEDTICYLLRIPYEHALRGTIAELVDRGLIAYKRGVFQVLPLPPKPSRGAQ